MKFRLLSQKTFAALTAVILLGIFGSPVFAAKVFYIGVDNNTNTEFEQEGGGRNNNTYYWEDGDYTQVPTFNNTPVGVIWSNGQEIWQDGPALADWGLSIDGFARAITNMFPTHHLFFQLDPHEVGVNQTLTLTIDFTAPGQSTGAPSSTHSIDSYLTDVLIHTETELSQAKLIQVTGIDTSGLEPGSHVLSLNRTGGVAGWVSIDYVSLEVVPEPPEPCSSCWR